MPLLSSSAMGCIHIKSQGNEPKNDANECIPIPSREIPKKEYSWDKRPKLNLQDYTIENIVNSTSIKCPGSIGGKQFIIQNCKNAFIYLLDYTNTITIDECVDCKIVMGPVRGSIFVRNCENCCLVAPCGQFRARDCHKIIAYLCCPSQPTIESCSKFRVGCCQLHYTGLLDQMKSAALTPFNNQWSSVFDFTPVSSEGPNWRTIPYEQLGEIFTDHQNCNTEELAELSFIFGDSSKSVIPLTSHGLLQTENFESNFESSFVAILPDGKQMERAFEFIKLMKNFDGNFDLVETLVRVLSREEALSLLPPPALNHCTDAQVQVLGLHFRGIGCVAKCHQVSSQLALSSDSSSLIHVSSTSNQAVSHIRQFMSAGD